MNDAIRTGGAFAVTAAFAYAACTLAFRLWPEAAVTFMNGLFHGLDFGRLQSGPALFSFGSFLYALIVLAAWAFGAGTLFDLARGWLARSRRV
jgi:hypothetical protein